MTEWLAIPGWQTGPTTLDAWAAALAARFAAAVAVERESTHGSWVEVGGRRLRGFAMTAGAHVEAIHFELGDPDTDPGPTARLLEEAAADLGWEIHPDDPDDDDPDDDDDDDDD